MHRIIRPYLHGIRPCVFAMSMCCPRICMCLSHQVGQAGASLSTCVLISPRPLRISPWPVLASHIAPVRPEHLCSPVCSSHLGLGSSRLGPCSHPTLLQSGRSTSMRASLTHALLHPCVRRSPTPWLPSSLACRCRCMPEQLPCACKVPHARGHVCKPDRPNTPAKLLCAAQVPHSVLAPRLAFVCSACAGYVQTCRAGLW